MKKYNPFHLVDYSPWPLFTSLCFMSFVLSVVIMFRVFSVICFLFSVFMLLYSAFLWGQDIHRESCYEGSHAKEVIDGLKFGMVIFILSECFFFLGIFWSYFHLAQLPAIEIGGIWPPDGISVFDPKGIPFFNTVLLVCSGVSVTLSHYSFMSGDYYVGFISLIFTIVLGLLFTIFQLLEYYVSGFTFSCSSYSSVYFLGTGFHGFHVIAGSVLLIICLFRMFFYHNSMDHMVGYECSIWYWHFVDVVWFFLYMIFYWWGV